MGRLFDSSQESDPFSAGSYVTVYVVDLQK